MFKRIVSAVIAAMMLLMANVYGEENDFIGTMQVIDCDEWVSLREYPDTNSERLAKVPLGATVSNCRYESQTFIYGEYEGECGYILAKYLAKPGSVAINVGFTERKVIGNCNTWVSLRSEPSISSARRNIIPLGTTVYCKPNAIKNGFAPVEYNGIVGYVQTKYLMNYSAGKQYAKADYRDVLGEGREILDAWKEGCHIIAVHSYSDIETMSVVCLNEYDEIIWNNYMENSILVELDCLGAFCNDETGVLLYNAYEGVWLVDILTGGIKWFVDDETLPIQGMCALTDHGISYIGGYFSPDPVAIDEEGSIIWQSYGGSEYFWLYELEITDEGLLARYEAVEGGENGGSIYYDIDTGDVLWREQN